MAHNLNEVKGKVAFAAVLTGKQKNEKAWHGLGTYFDRPLTMEEAIEHGGLDYTVEKKNLVIEGTDLILPSHMTTVRTDTGEALGVVGNDYSILQNRNAFDFFDSFSDGNVQIETVGALGKGERIFATAKLPHQIVVGRDDLTEMYMVMMNSHDGSLSLNVGLSPIRVVCQNTLNLAIRQGLKNKITLRHTGKIEDRAKQAGEIMRLSLKYQMELGQAFDLLYRKKVTDTAAKDLIRQIIVQDKKDSTRMNNILDTIEASYFTGVGQKEIVGTAWGVFNGITHYLSHEKSYKSEETKFDSLNGGESYRMITNAFNLLVNS